MSFFTRYILYEILKVFLVSLAALTFVMVMVGVVREAVAQGLGVESIVRLIPYVLPNALVFAIPGTLLLSMTIVYGRMAAENEILTMRSMGVSPMRAIWPAFAVAFLASIATVGLYELGAVWGYNGTQRVIFEAVEEIAYGALKTRGSISTNRFSIVVKDVRDHVLINPTFIFHSVNNSPTVTLAAAEGSLHFDPVANLLTVACRNGSITSEGRESLRFEDTFVHKVSLGEFGSHEVVSNAPQHLPIHVLEGETTRQLQQIEDHTEKQAALAAASLFQAGFEQYDSEQWKNHAAHANFLSQRFHQLRTESPRRWATGFSCFCFVFIGVPMAIRRRQADFVSTFFMCFLPILLVYYPFLMFGLDRSKAGDVPPYTVWLANGILLLWGFVLLHKVTSNRE